MRAAGNAIIGLLLGSAAAWLLFLGLSLLPEPLAARAAQGIERLTGIGMGYEQCLLFMALFGIAAAALCGARRWPLRSPMGAPK